jgi:transposase-like protein
LQGALGAAPSQRGSAARAGYRHGKRLRTLTTSLGATTIAMPRARIEDDQRRRREWRSQIIPRYQRRTERVDEAILGVYLSGTHTRRLRGALAPLLRGAPLSKDAVSRLMGRLREDFAAWAQRDLGELRILYLFLDGWYPRVRIGKKRVRVPVLVTLGVCADGRRVVLDLRLAGGDDLCCEPRGGRAGARRFPAQVELRCKAVSLSFEEAGDELFTFTAFPCAQWKALRTTNALERINEEFRRRTKTQASLPSEEAVLFLLFGLLRSGQVRLRRLVGWQDLTSSQMEAA